MLEEDVVLVSWEDYLTYINRLALCIQRDSANLGITYSHIYGIPRGGLIPAVIISHILEIPLVDTINAVICKTLLIVDDLVDSGETLSSYNCDTAVIFKNVSSSTEPTYWVSLFEGVIIFPYERKNEVLKNRIKTEDTCGG